MFKLQYKEHFFLLIFKLHAQNIGLNRCKLLDLLTELVHFIFFFSPPLLYNTEQLLALWIIAECTEKV